MVIHFVPPFVLDFVAAFVRVTERDRPLLDGDLLTAFTWTGPAPEVRMRVDALDVAGATEILYAPMGPDVPRELRTFMEMATA